MYKLTALYGHPASPEAFEDHYAKVHVPLARSIPQLEQLETARVAPRTDGSQPEYYRIAELWFADQAALGAALASEQGRAASADMANFATGGVTLLVADVDAV